MEDDLIARILIAHVIALPLLWAAAKVILNEQRVRAALGRAAGRSIIPSAEETRCSVARFQEAARRSELLDFVWERWLGDRVLFFRQGMRRK